MSDLTYLKKRRQCWYARVRVPPSLKSVLGTEITRSLHTRDLDEARHLRWAVVADIKAMIKNAQDLRQSGPSNPEWVLQKVRQMMHDVSAGKLSAEDARDIGLDHILEKHFAAAGYQRDEAGNPIIANRKADAQIGAAVKLATKGNILLASQVLEDYLSEIKTRIRPRTEETKRRILEAFIKWAGDVEMPDINKQTAGRYVTSVLMRQGKAVKTTKNTILHLSAFFSWAEARGMIELNPFAGLSKTVRESSRGTTEGRRPWTRAELKTLFEKVADDDLRALAGIALYSGMRIEEICKLRTDDVQQGVIRVTEGKSSAAIREVPVHPVIAPMLRRLRDQSKDGYIIPGLKESGRDKLRSIAIGKRFGRRIRAIGITDPGAVFHTLRNTFSQALETAGVPESTAKLIIGHERESLTYGLYSHGVPLQVLRQAVELVTFGSVDRLLSA